jgi:hypothetical protein
MGIILEDFLIQIFYSGTRLTNAFGYALIGAIGGALGSLAGYLIEKTTKKNYYSVVLIIFVVCFIQIPNVLIKPWLKNNYPEKIELQDNKILADEVNKSSVGRLDEITTLSYAEGNTRGITYHYNLDVKLADIEDLNSFGNIMKSQVVPLACAAPEVLELLNLEKILTYSYFDQQDTLITSFEVSKTSCPN